MYVLTRCKLCDGDAFITLYRQRIAGGKPWSDFIDAAHFPFEISGKLCRKCGWIFKDVAFSDEELARLYNLDDGELSEEARSLGDQYGAYRGRRIYETIEPWLNGTQGTVLDVGGRNGELMRTFVQRGYDVTVLDMDAGEPVAPRITKARAPFLDWTGGRYDVICMSHVLEHTESPADFLRHARTLLEDDGRLFIEVPSELFTCLVRRHAGDHRHLCYFTRQTLRSLLARTGYECLSCRLLVDVVGARIPLLRAVARPSVGAAHDRTAEPRMSALRSLSDVLHPLPVMYRLLGNVLPRPAGPDQ